jgi:multiple antibiotic resistance protein
LKILFPTLDSPRSHLPEGETSVFPLAIPLLAGPALLASIMLFAHIEETSGLMWGAILISWGAASIVLLASPFLERVLGKNGLMACERLMGMVLVLLAIQRFLEGVQLFVTGKC